MTDDTLIKVEGVSKKFCLSLKKSLWYGLCDMGRELTGRRHGTANQEVSGQGSEVRGHHNSSPSTFNLSAKGAKRPPLVRLPPSRLRRLRRDLRGRDLIRF